MNKLKVFAACVAAISVQGCSEGSDNNSIASISVPQNVRELSQTQQEEFRTTAGQVVDLLMAAGAPDAEIRMLGNGGGFSGAIQNSIDSDCDRLDQRTEESESTTRRAQVNMWVESLPNRNCSFTIGGSRFEATSTMPSRNPRSRVSETVGTVRSNFNVAAADANRLPAGFFIQRAEYSLVAEAFSRSMDASRPREAGLETMRRVLRGSFLDTRTQKTYAFEMEMSREATTSHRSSRKGNVTATSSSQVMVFHMEFGPVVYSVSESVSPSGERKRDAKLNNKALP